MTDTVKRAIRRGEFGTKDRTAGRRICHLPETGIRNLLDRVPLEDGAFEVLECLSHRMTVPGTEGSLP